MEQLDIMSKTVSSLYVMRDEVALEMIEAKGKQLSKLQTQLVAIEEAIYLKESGYEQEETSKEA